jgi:hypothetical protein
MAALTEEDIVRSPAWLPLEWVPDDALRLVRLDEAAYRRASFLDQRILGLGYEQQACRLATVRAAAARLAAPSHYVFHTGHVGSTLISRLIGAHENFFSLREPMLLRTLCALPSADAAPSLGVALALLGRTWRTNQRAVIKVTSFVSELAELILAANHRPVAIFMFAHPLAYVRGILAGPNSRAETRQLAPARLARLERRVADSGWQPDPGAEGEQIAMSWLCEMTALEQAAVRFERQILWMDFDAFLAEPAPGLEAVFQAFGARPSMSELEALVAGPLMQQYSKAPEHPYDAALRRAVLQSADREHAAEIRRAMDWLRRAATRHPLIEAALERSAGEGS